MSETALALECRQLRKVFQQGNQTLDVLVNIDFQVQPGERVAIVGPSGSGKSTLLQLLGGLDIPSSGDVLIQGQAITRLSDSARGKLRNRWLGFIYQFHHLLAEFSALENVAMPLLIGGATSVAASAKATTLLTQVGLAQRLQHRPSELSGGERQRAAIARALVTGPACVLADEPTGNLDRHSAEQVFQIMLKLNQELNTSLVIVTHDTALAQRMDSIWLLQDGRLERQQ